MLVLVPPSPQEVSFEESQKYKEGKYIVEKQRVMKVRRWKVQGTSGEMERSAGRGAQIDCAPQATLLSITLRPPIFLPGGKLVVALLGYIPFQNHLEQGFHLFHSFLPPPLVPPLYPALPPGPAASELSASGASLFT